MAGTDPLTATQYMIGLYNAPRDHSKCKDCGGTGLKPLMCCNGSDCGCQAMPYDFVECGCGAEEPSHEQILKWFQDVEKQQTGVDLKSK